VQLSQLPAGWEAAKDWRRLRMQLPPGAMRQRVQESATDAILAHAKRMLRHASRPVRAVESGWPEEGELDLERTLEEPRPWAPHALRVVRNEPREVDVVAILDMSLSMTGEKIALVGPTGHGKTSIVSALCRFYEVERGRILVDGVDVRDWDLRLLRRHIGLVLQDVFLFSGTVGENISLGNPWIGPEQIREAARRVHADRLVERRPRGYEEEVHERGATLSQGERQLLSFARALAFDPTILILDEATSSVDTETELLIRDALRVLLKDRTALVIAHRLSTIQFVDRILVVQRGRIREEGTHHALMEKAGLYRRLFELQYQLG
jgi:ABC-type multidrug transport system fused ATPase/permease subunit